MKPDPTLEAEAVRNTVINLEGLRLTGSLRLIYELGGIAPVLRSISASLKTLASDMRSDAGQIRDAQAALLRAQEDAGAQQ